MKTRQRSHREAKLRKITKIRGKSLRNKTGRMEIGMGRVEKRIVSWKLGVYLTSKVPGSSLGTYCTFLVTVVILISLTRVIL